MANLKHADTKHESMPVEVSGPVGSIPSFAAASQLLSERSSCLVLRPQRRHVGLAPMYLGRRNTGIRDQLRGDMLKFSHTLEGVPVAYNNVKILGPYGDIVNDSGYIHMDIIADFIVFQPRKGQKLLGKVNKLGVSHVGCLVHGCFNASIPKPNLVPMETWRDAGPRIGEELEFEVTALDADNVGVLLIRGRLDRTKVQELLAMGETSESSVIDQPKLSDTEANGELNPDPTEEPTVKKKKKKKSKIKEEKVDEEVTDPAFDSTATELNTTVNEEKGTGEKKKKKKKDKHLKREEVEEEVQVSAVEVHGSDSSGYQSDKPSKKRKRERAADIASSAGQGPQPKKSKKRKSGVEQFA